MTCPSVIVAPDEILSSKPLRGRYTRHMDMHHGVGTGTGPSGGHADRTGDGTFGPRPTDTLKTQCPEQAHFTYINVPASQDNGGAVVPGRGGGQRRPSGHASREEDEPETLHCPRVVRGRQTSPLEGEEQEEEEEGEEEEEEEEL
ncbi:unnamed protein product [Pleuronectes platessa]|uniref:Uncharacterized protein n=1 Tax=Pleuronectes platessa TaxID=8262 RepID=A0A9N7VWS5_PLEPL|nr:unnamed protein product [Pleuronectes platessa]